jgi:hypothetical protein
MQRLGDPATQELRSNQRARHIAPLECKSSGLPCGRRLHLTFKLSLALMLCSC